MSTMRRFSFAGGLLLAFALLSPSGAQATDAEPKVGFKYYVPGHPNDYICEIADCCVAWPCNITGPTCCKLV